MSNSTLVSRRRWSLLNFKFFERLSGSVQPASMFLDTQVLDLAKVGSLHVD